jgi:hypothetical protein
LLGGFRALISFFSFSSVLSCSSSTLPSQKKTNKQNCHLTEHLTLKYNQKNERTKEKTFYEDILGDLHKKGCTRFLDQKLPLLEILQDFFSASKNVILNLSIEKIYELN